MIGTGIDDKEMEAFQKATYAMEDLFPLRDKTNEIAGHDPELCYGCQIRKAINGTHNRLRAKGIVLEFPSAVLLGCAAELMALVPDHMHGEAVALSASGFLEGAMGWKQTYKQVFNAKTAS